MNKFYPLLSPDVVKDSDEDEATLDERRGNCNGEDDTYIGCVRNCRRPGREIRRDIVRERLAYRIMVLGTREGDLNCL